MNYNVADQSENDAAIISSLLFLMDSNVEQRSDYVNEAAGDGSTSSRITNDNLQYLVGSPPTSYSWCKYERQERAYTVHANIHPNGGNVSPPKLSSLPQVCCDDVL